MLHINTHLRRVYTCIYTHTHANLCINYIYKPAGTWSKKQTLVRSGRVCPWTVTSFVSSRVQGTGQAETEYEQCGIRVLNVRAEDARKKDGPSLPKTCGSRKTRSCHGTLHWVFVLRRSSSLPPPPSKATCLFGFWPQNVRQPIQSVDRRPPGIKVSLLHHSDSLFLKLPTQLQLTPNPKSAYRWLYLTARNQFITSALL